MGKFISGAALRIFALFGKTNEKCIMLLIVWTTRKLTFRLIYCILLTIVKVGRRGEQMFRMGLKKVREFHYEGDRGVQASVNQKKLDQESFRVVFCLFPSFDLWLELHVSPVQQRVLFLLLLIMGLCRKKSTLGSKKERISEAKSRNLVHIFLFMSIQPISLAAPFESYYEESCGAAGTSYRAESRRRLQSCFPSAR